MPDQAGHVYVLGGDIRRLACDAWALPADGAGNTEPAWLAWPPGAAGALAAPTPFAHWTQEACRARPVAGWPANLPAPWKLHVELAPAVPSSWLVEATRSFVDAAARSIAAAGRRRPGPGAPLLAVPLGVPGIGAAEGAAARRAAGRLARELLPELRRAAAEHAVDIALVAHSEDSLAAAWAARDQLDEGADPPPDPLDAGLDAVMAALAEDRLAVCVGPRLPRRAGLPSLDAVIDGLISKADVTAAWAASLRALPLSERVSQLASLVGGRGALARRIAESQARAHVSLGALLVAGLKTRLVIAEGPDDQLEQAFAATGRAAETVLDGGGARHSGPHGTRLVLTRGSTRRARALVELLQDPGRLRARRAAAMAAIRSILPADGHLLVIGHRPGPRLFHLLADLVPLVAEGPGPQVTVLSEGAAGSMSALWPATRVRWLDLDDDRAPGARRLPPPGGEAGTEARRAGRLARCLDRLGARHGRGRALLDPARMGLLSDADRALARGLDDLLARLPAKARDATLWPELRAWLRTHGHPAQ